MKKLKRKSGLTLIEMIISILILVFMVIGIGPGMDTAAKIYRESTFDTDSAMLADVINNTMGDILRYAEDVDTKDLNGHDLPASIPFVFTSYDYRIQDGYFYVPTEETGILQMKNLRNGSIVDLVNTGIYPDLQISDLQVALVEDDNYSKILVTISYKISSISDPDRSRDIQSIVRLMNPVN